MEKMKKAPFAANRGEKSQRLDHSGNGRDANNNPNLYDSTVAGVLQESAVSFSPKRIDSLKLSDCFSALSGGDRDLYDFAVKARRVSDCGSYLKFVRDVGLVGSHKLIGANFCRIRLCPMCEWRKAMKNFANTSRILSYLRGLGYEFVFVTLTIRNVSASGLKSAVKHLQSSFKRFQRRKETCGYPLWKGNPPFLGYQSTIEVTRNNDRSSEWYGTYHPHLHCVFVVHKNYFHGNKYLSRQRMLEIWRECARDEGITQVDIRAVRRNRRKKMDDISAAVAEISKYCCKPSDFLDRVDEVERVDVVWTLFDALRGVRLISRGGLVKSTFRDLRLQEEESGDLTDFGLSESEKHELYYLITLQWGMGVYHVDDVRLVTQEQLAMRDIF